MDNHFKKHISCLGMGKETGLISKGRHVLEVKECMDEERNVKYQIELDLVKDINTNSHRFFYHK